MEGRTIQDKVRWEEELEELSHEDCTYPDLSMTIVERDKVTL